VAFRRKARHGSIQLWDSGVAFVMVGSIVGARRGVGYGQSDCGR